MGVGSWIGKGATWAEGVASRGTKFLESNESLLRVKSSLGNSYKAAMPRARTIKSSLGETFSGMKPGTGYGISGGFATKAVGLGATGAAAAYYGGDPRDRMSNTIKGFGLGVVGAAGWHAGTDPALRAGVKDAWGWGKSQATKGWGAAKSYVNDEMRYEKMAAEARAGRIAH